MINNSYYPTILILDDNTKYYGWSFTNSTLSLGEVVFNTGITGYQEIITDPSYTDQIITFTYPEIGNTGINNEDNESGQIYIKGIIAKNICFSPSSWRHQISLIDYLKCKQIPHIFGIDTRALTKHLRKNGVMNGCISSKTLDETFLVKTLNRIPPMKGTNLVNKVTTENTYTLNSTTQLPYFHSHLKYKTDIFHGQKLNIAVLDLGVKYNILQRLISYGCNVTILPAYSDYSIINDLAPDGLILSNGPGDPSSIKQIIKNVGSIIKLSNIPILGICMGHQVLSLALGCETFKLKFGHRGINHPTGMYQKVEITSQNHGFAVNLNSCSDKNMEITHLNLNDNTVAGIIHRHKLIFSVQYHPEASPGPHDSDYLFYHFINLIKLNKHKKNIIT
uniref:carbamoyl phosphate synthase small subunit n=1 Tax=Catenella fusiformis TaxID=3024791 RepID=UPI0027DA40DF|nr:carbamoyl phosphate synthase small subunit [Catenella fusiformis]WCH57443.1 carbamoyl phosphate synthase small subunit [Catenella fusiformis]